MKSACCFLALLCVFFLARTVDATLYQVGPTRAKTNLQSIVNLVNPGDIVEVDGNVVYGGGAIFRRHGASNAPIVIRGLRVNGQRPIITGTNLPSIDTLISLRGNHYIFEGFELDAAFNSNVMRGLYCISDNVIVRDTRVKNCAFHGIQTGDVAGSFTLDNVEVHHCGNGLSYHQIYVASDNFLHSNAVFRMQFCYVHDGNGGNNVKSRVGRNEIYYNWIEGAYYHELDLIGADEESQPGAANLVREDSDVVGNVILKTPTSSSSGIIARLGTDGTGSSNGRYRFVNNTMILPGNYSTYAIRLRGPRESVELHNNVFDRGGGAIQFIDSTEPSFGVNDRVSGKNNFLPPGTTSIPQGIINTRTGPTAGFANPGAFNFQPGNGSLLLDFATLPTDSPTNFPFINPLTTPLFHPPLRTSLGINSPVSRIDDGAPDIGTFEAPTLPPGIITQPVGLTKLQGQPATFAVVANGSLTNLNPLRYQWWHENSAINNATNTSFTILNVQPNDAGNYRIVVTNTFGAVTSNPALLIVTPDTNKPTVSFTFPGIGKSVTNGIIAIAGTAKDTTPGVIMDVKYRLLPETEFTSATLSVTNGQTNWTTSPRTLIPGPSAVHAFSVDGGGNSSVIKTNTFYYNSTNLLTVKIQGTGQVKSSTIASITNNQTIPLLVGRPYSLTAFVGAGTNYIFTNWTDGTFAQVSTNLIYDFVMQSNLVLQANFIPNPFIPVAGNYAGLFSDPNNETSHESAGFFTVTVSANAGYSCKLIFDGDTLSGAGKFNLSGQTSRVIKRNHKGKPDINLSLDLNWSSSDQSILGILSDGNWISEMVGYKAGFGVTNPATAYFGKYTFLIPRTNFPAQSPGGFGYGLVTNNLLGTITLSGTLGDGATLVQKVSLSKDGKWPLYAQLYKSTNVFTNLVTDVIGTNKANFRGSLLGWITFTNQTLDGKLNWIKIGDAATNYFYPIGFSNEMEVIGSPYNAPASGARLLNVTNGEIIFTDGNLNETISNAIIIKTNNVVTVLNTNDGLKLTLTPRNGFLSGSFIHPAKSITTPFKGAVLQQQNFGGGNFAGTNQNGSVLLQAAPVSP